MSGLRSPQETAHHLAWLTLAILWLGGLSFYAAVVVPIGAELTSSTTQGFVTQRVTFWLNVLGTGYVVVTTRDLVGPVHRARQLLWCVLAAAQLTLWLLHPVLDALLDPTTMSVTDSVAFYQWHRLYLAATTIQWAAGVGHVWASGRSVKCEGRR